MKITLAQLNPIVGDISGNLGRAAEALDDAVRDGADLVVFSELFLTAYPPRDLLERPAFISRVESAVDELTALSRGFPGLGIIFGAPTRSGKDPGKGLYNSAVLIADGEIVHTQPKSLLPTYDVFDEARYFDSAAEIAIVTFKSETLGISVCEDAWNDPSFWPRPLYALDPIEKLAEKGATLLVNISASPFHTGKAQMRRRLIAAHAKKHGIPFVFVNQVGANDELIFDGRSLAVSPDGSVVAELPAFGEKVLTIDTETPGKAENAAETDTGAEIHDALVLGIRDYVRKCGFSEAIVALSGGIDSAVVAALAVEALGAERVLGVTMPGPYSSKGSVEDSRELASNLGAGFLNIPISPLFDAYGKALEEAFRNTPPGVAEENVQARIRGNIAMAISNKFGSLVLATGNKSEIAVGYCTLYGDTSGGLAPISDVPKTLVYKLAEYINRTGEVIPDATIKKPPSAELRPGQLDCDTLPPYEVLDEILEKYVDEGVPAAEIAKTTGFDAETVRWVASAVAKNEYKRHQLAPGLKVTTKAFGAGRRMPIAAEYKD